MAAAPVTPTNGTAVATTPSPTTDEKGYLSVTGTAALVGTARATNTIVADALAHPLPTTWELEQLTTLYSYHVPPLGPDGTCSKPGKLDPIPFDIAKSLLGSDISLSLGSHAMTERLYRLRLIVKNLATFTKMDWLGIYALYDYYHIDGDKRYPALIKLAYVGEPSRPVFPLSPKFLEISNNSWVAYNKRTKLLQDVNDTEGPYYICSDKVQSELCLPIIDPVSGSCVGIIDAESWNKTYFTPQLIAEIAQVCADLGSILASPIRARV